MNTITQIQEIRARIEREWDKKPHAKLDWLKLETLLVDVLRLDGPEGVATIDFRIALCKEVIDAFTHRGYFIDQYMSDPKASRTESVEEIFEGARKHGEEDDPDHEVGDLQNVVRWCWHWLNPLQRQDVLTKFREARASWEE